MSHVLNKEEWNLPAQNCLNLREDQTKQDRVPAGFTQELQSASHPAVEADLQPMLNTSSDKGLSPSTLCIQNLFNRHS